MAAPYPANTTWNAAAHAARETAGLVKMFNIPKATVVATINNLLPGAAPGQLAGDIINRTYGGPGDNSNLRPSYNITRGTIAGVLNPVVPGPVGIYNPIPRQTIATYLQMLCHYVNVMQPHEDFARDRHFRARPADIPVMAHLRNNFYVPPATGLAAYPAGHAWYTTKSNTLNKEGFSRARMIKMKHILLPIALPPNAAIVPARLIPHEILVVISPIGKTVDYLTSELGGIVNNRIAASDMYVIQHIAHLLTRHLGRDFCPQQWRLRVNGSSTHDHPNHSALWVMTNAMRVVFGYTLVDPPAGRNYENRRMRMATEISAGSFDEREETDRAMTRRYWYYLNNRDPWFSRSGNDWIPMNRAWIKNFLPVTGGRDWKAQNETKATLKHKCQTEMDGNRKRFRGWRQYLTQPFLDGFQDWFEW